MIRLVRKCVTIRWHNHRNILLVLLLGLNCGAGWIPYILNLLKIININTYTIPITAIENKWPRAMLSVFPTGLWNFEYT